MGLATTKKKKEAFPTEIPGKAARAAASPTSSSRITLATRSPSTPQPKAAQAAISNGSATASTGRSEEHTSELQSLMRISYAVFCLKKKHLRTTFLYDS